MPRDARLPLVHPAGIYGNIDEPFAEPEDDIVIEDDEPGEVEAIYSFLVTEIGEGCHRRPSSTPEIDWC